MSNRLAGCFANTFRNFAKNVFVINFILEGLAYFAKT
jgi:hypothetical protein